MNVPDPRRYKAIHEFSSDTFLVINIQNKRKEIFRLYKGDASNSLNFMQEVYSLRVMSQEREKSPSCVFVPSFYQSQITSEGLWYTREYLSGVRLDDEKVLNTRSFNRKIKDLLFVCQTLSIAHRQNLVHRDIKLDNIILNHLIPFLIDWSICIRNGETGYYPGMSYEYSPVCMAPEQAERAPLTPATDIYQLGHLIYEYLTGKRPYWREFYNSKFLDGTEVAAELKNDHKYLLGDDISPDLQKVIIKTWQKYPQDRYSNVLELSKDLKKLEKGESI